MISVEIKVRKINSPFLTLKDQFCFFKNGTKPNNPK